MRTILGTGLFTLCLLVSVVWANLAIAYQLQGSDGVRIGASLVLDVIALAALAGVVLRWPRRWLHDYELWF